MKLTWEKCEICKDLTMHIDGECKGCHLRLLNAAMLGLSNLVQEERQKVGSMINKEMAKYK
jgi:hypothetical protein